MPSASEYKNKLRPLFDTALNNLSAACPGKTPEQIEAAVTNSAVKLANAVLSVLVGFALPKPVATKPITTTPPTPAPPVTTTGALDFSCLSFMTCEDNGSGAAKNYFPVPAAGIPGYLDILPSGEIVTTAYVDGFTSSGSHYPRGEAQEVTKDGGKVGWPIKQGVHALPWAEFMIEKWPIKDDGKPGGICFSQFHGRVPSDEVMRLEAYPDGICAVDDLYGPNGVETKFWLKDTNGNNLIPQTGKWMARHAIIKDNKLLVIVRCDGVDYSSIHDLGPKWDGGTAYAKPFGAYLKVGSAAHGAGTTGPAKLPDGTRNRGVIRWRGPVPNVVNS